MKRNNNLYHEENDVVADAKVDSSEPYDGNDFNLTEKTGFSMQGLSRYKNNNGKSRLSSSSKGLLQMRTSLRHEIKEDPECILSNGAQLGAKGEREQEWSEFDDGSARSVDITSINAMSHHQIYQGKEVGEKIDNSGRNGHKRDLDDCADFRETAGGGGSTMQEFCLDAQMERALDKSVEKRRRIPTP